MTATPLERSWPHPGTYNGLAHALESDEPPGWMITAEGTVIGDCGTHGTADAQGAVEIGYGLADAFRGRGYATEAVGAMTEWLLRLPDTQIVRARTSPDNVASRLVLERNGFSLLGHDPDGQAVFSRSPRPAAGSVPGTGPT